MSVQLARPARPFTYEDLEGMPDDGYRREVIGGALVATPSPNGRHQRVAGTLLALFRAAETGGVMAMAAPYDWRTPDRGAVEPDVLVIRREDFDPDGPLPETAVPLLVVEVLSPSNPAQDRMVKRDLYERLGVPAYWIVDPLGPSLTALRLESGRCEVELDGAGIFHAERPLKVEIPISQLGD